MRTNAFSYSHFLLHKNAPHIGSRASYCSQNCVQFCSGACVEICQYNLFTINENTGKCDIGDESKCDRGRGCEKVCPTQAITID